MMEEFDVIIAGAGIAGTSLAARLSEICPDKKVLLIDKDKIGAGAAYGYRNVFKEIIDKYKLPYHHKFDGLKIGTHEELFLTVKQDCYLIDYEEVCRIFFNRSNAILKNEEALKVQDKVLKTNQNEYKFKYLIDCTGTSFFLRKILKLPLPFYYFLGHVKVLDNKLKSDDNFFYYLCENDGFVEDLYVLPDKTIQGDWRIVKKINFPAKYNKKFLCYRACCACFAFSL
jgi:flavin-dependent dehydrogenase